MVSCAKMNVEVVAYVLYSNLWILACVDGRFAWSLSRHSSLRHTRSDEDFSWVLTYRCRRRISRISSRVLFNFLVQKKRCFLERRSLSYHLIVSAADNAPVFILQNLIVHVYGTVRYGDGVMFFYRVVPCRQERASFEKAYGVVFGVIFEVEQRYHFACKETAVGLFSCT